MIPGTDEHAPRQQLGLCMALQAQVGIGLVKQIPGALTVGVVAYLAPLPHGLMLKEEGPRLLNMAFRAEVAHG